MKKTNIVYSVDELYEILYFLEYFEVIDRIMYVNKKSSESMIAKIRKIILRLKGSQHV